MCTFNSSQILNFYSYRQLKFWLWFSFFLPLPVPKQNWFSLQTSTADLSPPLYGSLWLPPISDSASASSFLGGERNFWVGSHCMESKRCLGALYLCSVWLMHRCPRNCQETIRAGLLTDLQMQSEILPRAEVLRQKCFNGYFLLSAQFFFPQF